MKISSLHVARDRDQRVAVVRLSYPLPEGVSLERTICLERDAEVVGDWLASVSLRSHVTDTASLLAAERWAGRTWGQFLAERLPGGEAELVGVAAADGSGSLDLTAATGDALAGQLRDLAAMVGLPCFAAGDLLGDMIRELRLRLPPMVRDLRERPSACEADLKRRLDERDKEIAALQDHLRREVQSSAALQEEVVRLTANGKRLLERRIEADEAAAKAWGERDAACAELTELRRALSTLIAPMIREAVARMPAEHPKSKPGMASAPGSHDLASDGLP